MKKKILNSFCSYLEANHISLKKHDCIISLFFNDIFFGKINFQFKKVINLNYNKGVLTCRNIPMKILEN